MQKRTTRRWLIVAALAIFFGIVIADAMGVFSSKPYDEVPHGDHVHYVPKDRDPSVSVSNFPTQPPGPGERITPQGQVVPAQ